MKFYVFLIIASLAFHIQGAEKPFGQLQDKQNFKDYTIRIYRDQDTGFGCFEILRSGKQVYFQKGVIFQVGDINYEEDGKTNDLIDMGRSITYEKQPNLMVSELNGGNNSDSTIYVFEIGSRFKQIGKIEADYLGESAFQDLRGDGNLEVVAGDGTFLYWNVDGADSRSFKVILRYRNDRYGTDLALMHKPAPSDEKLKQMAEKFKDLDVAMDWPCPFEMWQEMLDLIYTGNMSSAWKLLDLSWPAGRPGKAAFLRTFKAQLKTSPYYKDIMQTSFQGK